MVSNNKDINIYTFNQSIPEMMTKREESIGTSYDVEYNYDDRC